MGDQCVTCSCYPRLCFKLQERSVLRLVNAFGRLLIDLSVLISVSNDLEVISLTLTAIHGLNLET